jgi:hypothetical protein
MQGHTLNLSEATALVLMASSIAGGFISGFFGPRGASSPGGVSEIGQ